MSIRRVAQVAVLALAAVASVATSPPDSTLLSMNLDLATRDVAAYRVRVADQFREGAVGVTCGLSYMQGSFQAGADAGLVWPADAGVPGRTTALVATSPTMPVLQAVEWARTNEVRAGHEVPGLGLVLATTALTASESWEGRSLFATAVLSDGAYLTVVRRGEAPFVVQASCTLTVDGKTCEPPESCADLVLDDVTAEVR